MVKIPPAMQETWVQSLGQEDPLEKDMVTHSSILAWKNPMDRGAWQATVHGVARAGHNLGTKQQQHTSYRDANPSTSEYYCIWDGWALNQPNCCSKKRKFGHTETPAMLGYGRKTM